MSVHYKFKSNLNFDTLTFDGVQISVGDLKKSIIKQKKLGKITDFELQVTNAQTKEVYASDNVLIPKNTSLIIARIPISNGTKKVFETQTENMRPSKIDSKLDGVSLDLTQLQASEEEKIQAMMMQSTADYDPKSYYKLKPQSQIGEVPASYKCNKCKKGGHWIKNCPFTTSKDIIEVKRNTGIPMSFREKKDNLQETLPPTEDVRSKRIIPDELLCGICKDLFVDAVMIPCCGSSFCDDCVRTALLESDDNECPDCKEKGSSPASLIPNRFLRNSVNAFRNENGYSLERKANNVSKQEESEMEINNQNEEKNVENENTKAVSSTSNLDTESTIDGQISNPINQTEQPAAELSVPKPDVKLIHEDDSQTKQNECSNILEAVIPEKQKEIKPRIAVSMEINKPPQELVQNSHMQICEPTSFKPIRPFTQFPPLQPQPLNTFDNMFNRIRPPMGPIQYHSAVRPRMDHVQPGYYQPSPHIMNAKKTLGPVGIDTLYSGVAATLGNGIIDDPLEAFNRIMEEKEKRRTKERRSRSKERPKRWYHRSPSYDRRTRRISNSNEKRICRDDYNKNNNRENHSSNASRYRRSNSKTMSRSRSKTPIRQHSRSPKSKRSGEIRRRNDPKERIEKKNWNERSCDHRSENSAYKFNNRTDFMRQPSPPGSDTKYSFKTRLSRSRSTSPEVKRYRKKSSDCKREDLHSKHKNIKKPSPLLYCDIQGKLEENQKLINVRDKLSPSFHTSENTFIKDIVEKDFAISDRKSNDFDKLIEEEKEKSLPKDGLKKEKKSKERKKKKKDKLEKNEKKKNKKTKKEKKSRKSAEKPETIPSSKDVSPGRTPETQLPDLQQDLNTPSCDQSLTPPNVGAAVKCVFESPKSHVENEASICQISTSLTNASRSPKSVEFELDKPHNTLRSFVEMPHCQSNDRNKEDILQSKYQGNSIDRRFDDRRTHSKEHFKKESQMYQTRNLPSRRDKLRDDAYKIHRSQEDQRKNHRKPADNFELRSVAAKMHWNPRIDNPFRRNRLHEKFDSQHASYRRSTNISSNSEAYSDGEDNKRKLRTDKKDKDRKRIKYTSSEDSFECLRRKPLKNKKKHKNLKKKKKSRE